MGLNFRKSIKIAPGIRVNISKKGLSSVSVGGKGARVNVSKKGTRTTVGIPGTGLSYTTNTSYKKSKGAFNEPVHLIQQEGLGKEKRNILVSILLWIGILCVAVYALYAGYPWVATAAFSTLAAILVILVLRKVPASNGEQTSKPTTQK